MNIGGPQNMKYKYYIAYPSKINPTHPAACVKIISTYKNLSCSFSPLGNCEEEKWLKWNLDGYPPETVLYCNNVFSINHLKKNRSNWGKYYE